MVMPERNLKEALTVRYARYPSCNVSFVSKLSLLRYTGVTCDPEDFEAKNYFLRQNISGRDTELAIAITMFNVR